MTGKAKCRRCPILDTYASGRSSTQTPPFVVDWRTGVDTCTLPDSDLRENVLASRKRELPRSSRHA